MAKHRLTAAEERLIGQTINSRYKIESFIGKGDIGPVYSAQDLQDSKRVAIKTIQFDLSETELRERFKSDAVLLSGLKHPNLAVFLDFGLLESGGGYFVMEYVGGIRLRDKLEREKRLSVDETLQIVREICCALSVAHSRGIIHLDLTPENIMYHSESHKWKVLDLGLAKLKENVSSSKANITAVSSLVGNAAYMSPEQGTGVGVDTSTDIYSLGIMIYEMLTGTPPFQGGFLEVVRKHMIDPVPSPAAVVDIPAQLDTLVQRLLQKTKDKRPQNVEEIISAIDALRSTKSPTVQPAVESKAIAESSVIIIVVAVAVIVILVVIFLMFK